MTRTLGLLYDTHVTHGRKDGNGQQMLEDAISRLNSVGVDHTLHGGDMRPLSTLPGNWRDWGDDNKYYHKDFDEVKTRLENQLNSDYYLIRGNHERPEPVVKEYFPPEEYSPNEIDHEDGDPRGYYGSEVVNGVRYVYLDNVGTEGFAAQGQLESWVSANQLSMLDRLADEDPNIPTFVFVHNPLVIHDGLGGYDLREDKGLNYELIYNRASVRSRLERMNTQLVHSGHIFSEIDADVTTVNGIDYSICDHLYRYGTDPDGDLRWLTVNESAGSATLTYYDYETGVQSDLTTVTW